MTVHPVSLQAASVGPDPSDGLQAKFSIPYLTAYTLMHGPPTVESFDSVDAEVVERARAVEIRTERGQLESEFVLHDWWDGDRASQGGARLAAEADGPGGPGREGPRSHGTGAAAPGS